MIRFVRDFRVPPSACPHCGAVHTGATEVYEDTNPPGPGDVSLCVECAELCVFDEALHLRAPTPTEQVVLGMQLGIPQAQAVLRHLKRQGVPE